MGQKIPLGLVTIAQGLSGEISGQETLERPVIKKLWQAFSASRQASQSEVDQRLEYLFWRIWSSEELARRINLQSLNCLVSNILASSSTEQARPQKIPSLPRAIAPSATGHSHSKSHPTAGQSLHPILKKPATAPSETQTQKSARLLLERPEGGNITCNPSTPPTPAPASPEDHTKDIPTTRPTPKKAYPAAMRPIKGNRRRPVFGRRKSSQSSTTKNQPSTPRAIESKAIEGSERRCSTTDEEPEPAKSESETGHSQDDNESDFIPFPIELSPPVPQQPSHGMNNLTESTLLTELTKPEIKTNVTVTPRFLPISENRDSMLSQEIETVSQDPMPQEEDKQRAEIIDSSSESDGPDGTVEGTDVPGFPGAKRVPMPKKMRKRLLRLMSEARNKDTKQKIPLPNGPPSSSERAWLPLYPQPYLEDWMLQDETTSSAPQPSNRLLVAPGFRKRFAVQLEIEMEIWRKEEEARKELEALDIADSEVGVV